MPQIIRVTLVADALHVDQTNHDNSVGRHPQQQELHLKLDNASLPGATFLPMGARGGFTWISTPPDAVFTEPKRIGSDRIVQLKVQNDRLASAGCWIYMIRVLYQGWIYWTTVSSTDCDDGPYGDDVTAMVSNNPIIINR